VATRTGGCEKLLTSRSCALLASDGSVCQVRSAAEY
jgi:hypothetical protein